MSIELVLLIGIPGSGKTTLATSMTQNGPYYRVNKDDLRQMLGITKFSRSGENTVKEVERTVVKSLLLQGVSVIVDNTHLGGGHRDFYAQLARDIGKVKGEEVRYREILLTDSYNLDLCKSRVEDRNKQCVGHKVPLEVVELMYKKLINWELG